MRIGLCGLGRAGKEVAEVISKRPDIDLVFGLCRNGSDKKNKLAGELFGISDFKQPVYEVKDINKAIKKHQPDVIIDFSAKDATMKMLPSLALHRVSLVICTTGFTPEELDIIKNYGEKHDISIAYAPNVTVGINVLIRLATTLAKCLPTFDFLITERHHSKKVDPISATAEKLADALDAGFPKGKERTQITGVRAGGYIGVHEINAVGEFEEITISHSSFSRKAFANGAILAASYIWDKAGFYLMNDIVDSYLVQSIKENLDISASPPVIEEIPEDVAT